MASTPSFASTPRHGSALLSNSGTVVTLLSAVPAGTRVDRAVVQASGTTTAHVLRFLINDGSVSSPFIEQPISANSVTVASNQAVRYELGFVDLTLCSGESLQAVLTSSENSHVHIFGADLT